MSTNTKHLTMPQSFDALKWLRDNIDGQQGRTRAEVSKTISEAVGFRVSEGQLIKILRDFGLSIKPVRQVPTSELLLATAARIKRMENYLYRHSRAFQVYVAENPLDGDEFAAPVIGGMANHPHPAPTTVEAPGK